MQIAIIKSPDFNDAHDIASAIKRIGMEPVEFLWDQSVEQLSHFAGYIIIGSFSNDAILAVLKEQDQKGKPILGIGTEGARVLVKSGLVPGLTNYQVGLVLTTNKPINTVINIRLNDSYQLNAFTRCLSPKNIIEIALTEAAGCFVIPPALLMEMQNNGQTVFQYCDHFGKIIDAFPVNPHGLASTLAAVSNKAGNVMAMIPHPEHTTQGDAIFQSMRDFIADNFIIKVAPMYYQPRHDDHAEIKIRNALSHCLTETHFQIGKKYKGKVRDTYDLGDRLMLVTTDRQSAFDRILASVPYKGQVLNLISAWWFEHTQHIIPNHLIAVPDPNVMIAKKCKVFPIEFVVRGYITGTTNTALWTQYKNGVRHYCGHDFPEGLVKNQQLEKPILTPTTKDEKHDRPISAAEIVAEGWMTQEDWDIASAAALRLYEFGAETAAKHGLILVDTKYEMGKDADGNIILIDEVHTPDSSRYWLKDSYAERFANHEEPGNIDKEFLRLWFAEHCDPYNDVELPKAPDELIVTLASRYIQLFEMITGQRFQFPEKSLPVLDRIMRNVAGYLV